MVLLKSLETKGKEQLKEIQEDIVSLKTSDTSAKERIDEIDTNQQKLEQKVAVQSSTSAIAFNCYRTTR